MTTMAGHMGQISDKMGYHYIAKATESSATGLLGQYVVQSAPKTWKQLQKAPSEALGKVLSIDEVYRITSGQ